eukprot:3572138-Pleurochrysis_carterae.AAC.1
MGRRALWLARATARRVPPGRSGSATIESGEEASATSVAASDTTKGPGRPHGTMRAHVRGGQRNEG